MISFFVAGEPKAQPRPRPIPGRRGVYNPATANEWKALIKVEAQKQRANEPMAGPIGVALVFAFVRPNSHFRVVAGKVVLRSDAPIWYACKPDIDNLDKAVLDAITDLGGIWHDDSQVTNLLTEKRWAQPGEMPGCAISIGELDNNTSK